MSKSLTMSFNKLSISIPRTVIAIVALVLFSASPYEVSSQANQDGPVSVTYGDLFQKGELKIEPFDLNDLRPLPLGYAALNNKAYRITTTAVVAGVHTVRFAIPSVTEEDAFKKLRIFHLDTDPYDPDSLVWKDVTVLNSATTPPSFSARTIYGNSEGLGIYVVAKLIREVVPNTAIADLVVTTIGAPDRLTAPSMIGYTIKVLNQGPDEATDVGLWDGLSAHLDIVSVEPSQGKCKSSGGHIVCKLGSLRARESVTVAVKLRPLEGRGNFPQEGKEVVHDANATAVEKDPAPENNEASDATIVFPDPNQLPSVTLNTPEDGRLFVGPTDIVLKAAAEDSDGTISKVEFFDNEKSLGLGASDDGKNFMLTVRGLSYGKHLFVAVATDSGGRSDWSLSRGVFVNGLSEVSVKMPTPGSLVSPGSDVPLVAFASHPSGVIAKVQFLANGRLLGEGSRSDHNTFRFNWKEPQRGNYSVAVIAIDGSGISTISTPVKFSIGNRTQVAIISPTDSARFSDSTNLSIAVKANQTDGLIRRVDLYANDNLIGSSLDVGAELFTFTWRHVPEGQHTLKAVAVDEFGMSQSSKPITFRVEKFRKNH